METIDLTPEAFLPSNPNAQRNIAKADKAAKELENVTLTKSDLLRDLYTFLRRGGVDIKKSLVAAVAKDNMACDMIEIDAEAADLIERWEGVNRRHEKASKALHESMRGI